MLKYGSSPSAENLKNVAFPGGNYYCDEWNSAYSAKALSINLVAFVLWLFTLISEKLLVSITNLRAPISEQNLLLDNMRISSLVKFLQTGVVLLAISNNLKNFTCYWYFETGTEIFWTVVISIIL